jgi:hypothetical protein
MIQKPANGKKAPDVIVDPSPDAPFTHIIRLCNFKDGHADLEESHKSELRNMLTRFMVDRKAGHVDFVGFSSKLAFADKTKNNQKLSEQRAAAAKNFVADFNKRFVTGVKTNVVMGLADSGDAQRDQTGNDGFFRAVEVKFVISGNFNPVPTPKPVPPPVPTPLKPASSFIFQAIQVSSASLGLKVSGVESDTMEFAIRDVTNGKTRYYLYIGGAATIPTPDRLNETLKKILSLPIGVSVGRQGDKKSFITRKPIRDMSDWEGPATLVQGPGAGLGSQSVGGAIVFRISPKNAPQLDASSTISLSFTTAKGITTPSLGGGGAGIVVMLNANHKPRKFPGEDIL